MQQKLHDPVAGRLKPFKNGNLKKIYRAGLFCLAALSGRN
jgi:hypothetical protein